MLPLVVLIQLHLYISLAGASTIKHQLGAHESGAAPQQAGGRRAARADSLRGRALELGNALPRDDKMDDLFYSHGSNALDDRKEGREEEEEEGVVGRRPGRHRAQLNRLQLGDLIKTVDFDQLASENTLDEPEMVVNNHQVTTASTSLPVASKTRHYANYHLGSSASAMIASGHHAHQYGKYSPNMFANNYNLNYIHSLLTSKPALSSGSLSLQTMQSLLNSNPNGLTLSASLHATAASLSPGAHASASASSSSLPLTAAYQPSGIRGHQHQQQQQAQANHYSSPLDGGSSGAGGGQLNLSAPATSPVADYSNPAHCGRQQVAAAREPRIVGGNSTYEGEFPWAVSIQRHGNHHCGGVIVGHRWILTAAHCVRSQLASNLAVRTGGHTLTRSVNSLSGHLERDFPVDQIIMHDDFSRYDNLSSSQMKSSASTNNADIALLKLKQEIRWNEHAWPVCFPNREAGNFSGHDATVIGWGKLNEKSEEFSNELQKVKLTIIDNKVCQNWFRQAGREMPIDDRIICAGFKNGGKDACHGDSGGPLLSRQNGQYVVVGVVSTGIGCARPLLPGLYSRVSSYINWIERYITN